MTNCPKCGRPVGGRARVCGYCGESLVQEYFRKSSTSAEKSFHSSKQESVWGFVSCLLGTVGGLLLLAAIVFHFLALYGFGPDSLRPSMDVSWWVRAVGILLPSTAYLGRRIALGRRCGSLIGEGVWLTAASCGFAGCFLIYWGQGPDWFYGLYQIPYLCTAGFGLTIVAQLAAIGNSRSLWKLGV